MSNFMYDNLLLVRTNIYECILRVIERLNRRLIFNEDYVEKSSLIYSVFEEVTLELLLIIREMFDRKNE